MHGIHRFVACFTVLALLANNTGCTSEKAKALQTAATSFSTESESAITLLQDLFNEDVGVAIQFNQDEFEETLKTLQKQKSINAETLTELLTGSTFRAPAIQRSEQEFNELRAQYQQFAAMYHSLERGYLFAGKSVKQSEA